MGRRKQSKPVAKRHVEVVFDDDTTNKGLVEAIWDAAREDEALYLKESGRNKRIKASRSLAPLVCRVDPCSAFEQNTTRSLVAFAGVSVGNQGREVLERILLESCDGSVATEWVVRTTHGHEYGGCAEERVVMELQGGGLALLLDVTRGELFVNVLKNQHISLGPLMKNEQGGLCIGVSVTDHAFRELTSYPEDAKGTAKSRAMVGVLSDLGCVKVKEHGGGLLPGGCPMIVASDQSTGADDTELDAARLYQLITPTGDEPEYNGPLSQLKPKLHGYQRRVLHWMIARENISQDTQEGLLQKPVQCLSLARNDTSTVSAYNIQDSKLVFWINPYTGMLYHHEQGGQSEIKTPRGGIACDEMGLGKTVEMLALIAANPATHIESIKSSNDADRQGLPSKSGEILCVCGVSGSFEYGQVHLPLMVSCVSCGVWSHLHCNGMNSFSDLSSWKCSKCCSLEVIQSELLESRATLIVCPVPILSQWESEIEKHVVKGAMKVVKYFGQEQPKSHASSRVVTPEDLADADIVLTTYDTLRHDLYRNPDRSAGRSLRYEKRYQIVPTPLTSVNFWRIVVDEAQMVESSTAKATEMVRKIAAVHLWCVTGTPISRGLEDLFGLLSFLRVEPYGFHGWWSRLIQKPLESKEDYEAGLSRLVKLLKPSLGGLMWRSSKADVSHEICIPKQNLCTSEIRFSNIEKHFYERQHQTCCGVAKAALAKASKRVNTQGKNALIDIENEPDDRLLTKSEERKLLLPLLRLRQACVHPQVGAGGIKSLSHLKTPMSMIQVLQVMVTKSKVDAEDAQRLLLATINGIAGLKILQEKFAEAASEYRKVLHISHENESLIKADKLQILHTVFNLKQILDRPGVGKTISDSDLENKVRALENSYISEPTARLDMQYHELNQIKNQESGIMKKFKTIVGDTNILENWWVSAIHFIQTQSGDNGDGFVADLKRSLTQDELYRQTASRNVNNLADRFKDVFGLKVLLGQELNGQEEARKDVVSLLDHLGKRVEQKDPSLIDAAAHCATCRSFNAIGGVVCEHCHFDKSMIAWEVRLFTLVATARGKAEISTDHIAEAAHQNSLHRVGMGGIGEKGFLHEGYMHGKRTDKKVADSKVIRGPSQAEKVLRYIASNLRSHQVHGIEEKDQQAVLMKASKYHLDLMELRRKEYLKVGAVASAQRQVLYALDELHMSQMRIKLRGNAQTVTPEEERYIVHAFELPSKLVEFQNEYIVAQADMQKSLGTLKYLKTLEHLNQDSSRDEDFKLEPCPVCHELLGNDMAMLPCGHMLCVACNVRIVEKENKQRNEQIMKCPTCRSITPASETAVVTNQSSREQENQYQNQRGLWYPEHTVAIKGSFGSKIEAIVKRIMTISQKRPNDKTIVFSSWKDALDILAYALDQNDCQYLYPKNGKMFDQVISIFRDSLEIDCPRVLLLMLKQGGNGLNLQQAQHVIFVEPVMDPGEEAQAIGRVDRMGQEKETFIHKFIVQDSVEENVCRINEQKKLQDGIISKHHNQNKHHLSLNEVTTLLK